MRKIGVVLSLLVSVVYGFPQLQKVSEGSAEVKWPDENTMVIRITSEDTILEFDEFVVSEGETIKLIQPNNGTTVIGLSSPEVSVESRGSFYFNGKIYFIAKSLGVNGSVKGGSVLSCVNGKGIDLDPRKVLEDIKIREKFGDKISSTLVNIVSYHPRRFFSDWLPYSVYTRLGCIVSSEGHILTYDFPADSAKEITVYFSDQRTAEAVLVNYDPSTRLAVLKVEKGDYPYLTLRDSESVKADEKCTLIGGPSRRSLLATPQSWFEHTIRKERDVLHLDDKGWVVVEEGGFAIDSEGKILGVLRRDLSIFFTPDMVLFPSNYVREFIESSP